jgi:ABC-type tungstate transport system substrate-binding protein
LTDLWQAFALAVDMVYPIDPLLLEIVLLSLKVSLSAAALACLFGLPLGALLATRQFRGKWLLTLLVNTLMGMPPVVIGLLVYIMYETRFGLLTVALAGFGRAIAEVGAVMIVGGNIAHLTRVMTTAIALETSKGDLALALALGIVLMTLALLINSAVLLLRQRGVARSYA